LNLISGLEFEPLHACRFLKHLDVSGEWWYAFLGLARWIGFRLDVISATTLLATCLLAMATRGSVSPYLLGLALTYTLQLTGSMQWFVRQVGRVLTSQKAGS
jgi:hypothetical protein